RRVLMDVIIFAHPDNKGSHNAAVLRHVKARIEAESGKFEVIDLYADGFDPVLRYGPEGPLGDPKVEKYQELLRGAKRLIFIYPVWWYNAPAIMKGFIDKVFTPGFAYSFKTDPVKGFYVEQLLKGKEAIVINTYGGGSEWMDAHGNAPMMVMDKAALDFCGISVQARINWFGARGPAEVPKEIAELIDAEV
ncbi:MAG: NAD(P)H-dependent oxidoreductase, partial [Candidatus Micrarchaeota archaeon]